MKKRCQRQELVQRCLERSKMITDHISGLDDENRLEKLLVSHSKGELNETKKTAPSWRFLLSFYFCP